MMHDLEVPLPLAGLQIDADQAVAEQIVARPLAAVVIRGRRLHRQINQPEIFGSTVICVHTPVLPL